MSGTKKFFNVLGIIAAWLLSIVLVVMLIATPIVFSALSLLDAKTITKAVTGVMTNVGEPSASQSGDVEANGYGIIKLSNTSENAAPANGNDLSDSTSDILGSLVGDALPQETLDAILNSKAAQELLATYAEDIANAINGSGAEAQLNAEKLKKIVNDNIDEIVQIIQTASPDMAQVDAQEIKDTIQTAINDNADQIVQALPKPEEIKQELVQESPELEMALEILANRNTIKLVIIGVIVLLSALIFVCRLWGFRGFRWLAVDLFVAAGIGLLPGIGLLVSSSVLNDLMAENEMLSALVGSLVASLASGMLLRAGIMLLSGGVLLTAYILIKKAKAKKCLNIKNEECEECENAGCEDAEV